jgi:hypothetical protein
LRDVLVANKDAPDRDTATVPHGAPPSAVTAANYERANRRGRHTLDTLPLPDARRSLMRLEPVDARC